MLLESVASIGILFFFYSRARLGHVSPEQKRALNITVGGMSLPFVFGIGLALILCKIVAGTNEVDFARFLIFMWVVISLTTFPVLARILTELKLLTPHSSHRWHRHDRHSVQWRRQVDPPHPRHCARKWRRQQPRSQEPLLLATGAPLRHGLLKRTMTYKF